MSDSFNEIDNISSDLRRVIISDQAALLADVLNMYPVLVDRRDINERCWMHDAADAGSWGCLSILKNHGLDVNTQDVMGETPLHRAVVQRHYDATNWLLQNGADPSMTNRFGASPTLYAAGWSNDMLSKMLEAGGSGDIRDHMGDGVEEWAKRGARMAVQASKLPKPGPSSPK